MIQFKKLLLLAGLLAFVAGCGDSQDNYVFTGTGTGTTGTTGTGTTGTGTGTGTSGGTSGGTTPIATLTSIALSPATSGIVSGATQTYVATGTYSDGSTGVVTNQVAFTSANVTVATVVNGTVTGAAPGSTVITATVGGVSATANLSVSARANAYALNAAGTGLVRFTTAAPGTSTALAINGLAAGDVLVGIDFRPQNGFLYGLALNDATGDLQLYCISTQTAPAPNDATVTATAVGTPIADDFVAGTTFGVDFNPVVDRLRAVASTGENLRINPNTGTYAPGTPDINLNGAVASASAAAYSNNNPNTTVTTLFTLDAASNSLYIQNPPNDGTQTATRVITSNGATVDFDASNGFDIPFGVNAATNNAAPAAGGQGLAALTVAGRTGLYSIDLNTGAAFNLGDIAGGLAIRGLAIQSTQSGTPAIGLSADGNTLVRFNTDTPTTTVNATDAISGLQAGETLVGVDYRPATGQLFGFGVNAAANTGTIYRLDPQTGGAATAILANGVAFVTAAGVAVDFPDPATSGYGFDFNPTVDRIRLTTSTGINARLNQLTGTGVDGDTVAAGTNPDGNVNGGATGVSAAAYTNSFATAAGTGVTTLYTLDDVTNSLFIQNPPNAGTQVLVAALNLNGVAIDFGNVNGFDIENTITAATNNAAAAGRALAVLTVGGANGLYSINLANGAATLVNSIAAGRGLALGHAGALVP